MKTSSLLVAAFTLVAGYAVYQSQQKEQMSDIALENVEALADGEVSENGYGRNFDLMDRCNKNI